MMWVKAILTNDTKTFDNRMHLIVETKNLNACINKTREKVKIESPRLNALKQDAIEIIKR
jgi:hypothetical protein